MDFLQILSLDIPPLLTAAFSALACALLGNYLLLRKLSMMGDAISHSVLPGIVAAFLLTSSRSSMTVFVGAVIAAILSAVLVETVRRYGNVETGASMGVVFSLFFALGVLLIEQAAARNIDLDADCLLHGQLESIFWYPPQALSELFTLQTLNQIPGEVISSFFTFVAVLFFIILFYKELKITSFDPALSDSLGYKSSTMHHLLMTLVACGAVASFKAVGSILVIAMIICPAATARLCTDKLHKQLILSSLFALLSVTVGYTLGAFGPQLLGYSNSVNAAGMIAVVSGILLTLSVLLAPEYGVIARLLKQSALALNVRIEDILGFLYRLEEAEKTQDNANLATISKVFGRTIMTRLAVWKFQKQALGSIKDGQILLSDTGRQKGQGLVRTHRLWELYLVNELGMDSSHVHETAERLEHFTDLSLQEKIAELQGHPEIDPHGKKVPGSTAPQTD